MDEIVTAITSVNGVVWGPWMLVAILGTGLFLTIGIRAYPIRNIGLGFRLLFAGRHTSTTTGDISPFHALMTSLSATVGTGNIAGVATAISMGGPGALFWMWCTALLGMATKYAEAVCAVKYREVDEQGNYSGGPMYYIRNGLGPKWQWLAVLFAIFGTLAGFGIGNTVQAHSVADALASSFSIPAELTAIVSLVLVGMVILGGVKRIAAVAGVLVPFMALGYLLVGLIVIALNLPQLPAAVVEIVQSAFTGTAATGGFAGAGVMMAIQFGVARGIFSNEAGMGSAPIAHAAARTNDPVKQGSIAMLGTFIDTLVICSITGLVIVMTGAWEGGSGGASLTTSAFASEIPFGDKFVSVALCLFAFTTLLGWSYYGERCIVYLFGARAILPFRILWVLAIPVGAMATDMKLAGLDLIWLIADTLNALMALPNLIALVLLSPVVFQLTRQAVRNP